MKLNLTLENEIRILRECKLTADELLLVRTLLIMQSDGDESLFRELFSVLNDKNGNVRDLLCDLQQKGWIVKSCYIPKKGEEFDPYSITINSNFSKTIFKSSLEAGQEIFDHYPKFAIINGNMVGLRTVSKKFDSLEDAFMKYGKNIRWSPAKHKRVIELLDWANERNIINYSMASFIIDQRWLELEDLMNGDAGINYDTVKLI